jgi:transcriptional regulator with GAF, ATPase, and Fis domain
MMKRAGDGPFARDGRRRYSRVHRMTRRDAPNDDGFATLLTDRSGLQGGDNCFQIRVLEGVDQGKSLLLDGSLAAPVLVGTSPTCDIRLTDPEVSRRHASLELVDGRVRIQDLESTNGTFVDRVAIVGAYLNGGELVRMGKTALQVLRVPASPAPPLPAASHFGRTLGASPQMRRLYPICARLAASTPLVPVIIEGETGTGKEVLAESLHEEGPRADKPFIVFDCTAVAPTLVESELFGHERGAFTGAVSSRKGVFEQAHGGTLLIDEIGDLDLTLQPKLLRVLEKSEVRRVGGDRPIRVDVHVLSATRRDLDREVQAGRFRDDLFHRLSVARVELPPLRKRRGDIPLLAHHFAQQLSAGSRPLGTDLIGRWENLPWPGNVRELRNAVAKQIVLGELADGASDGDEEEDAWEPAQARSSACADNDIVEQVLKQDLPLPVARQRVIGHFLQRYLAHLLAKHGGSVAKAAKESGVARRHFQRLLARWRAS